MPIEPIRFWKGVNQTFDPQLLEEGELVDGKNFHSRHGSLEKRLGFAVVEGLLDFDGKLYWPGLIFSFTAPYDVNIDPPTGFEPSVFPPSPPWRWPAGGAWWFRPPTGAGEQPPTTGDPVPRIQLLFGQAETELLPVIPDCVEVDTPFFLVVAALDVKTQLIFVNYDGTGANIAHDWYLEVTGEIKNASALVREDNSPLNLNDPADWDSGIWAHRVKFSSTGGGDRLAIITTIGENKFGGGREAVECIDLYLHWKFNEIAGQGEFGDIEGSIHQDSIDSNLGYLIGPSATIGLANGQTGTNTLDISSNLDYCRTFANHMRASLDGDFTWVIIFKAPLISGGAPNERDVFGLLWVGGYVEDLPTDIFNPPQNLNPPAGLEMALVQEGVDEGKFVFHERDGGDDLFISATRLDDDLWHSVRICRDLLADEYVIWIDDAPAGTVDIPVAMLRGYDAFDGVSAGSPRADQRFTGLIDDFLIIPGCVPPPDPCVDCATDTSMGSQDNVDRQGGGCLTHMTVQCCADHPQDVVTGCDCGWQWEKMDVFINEAWLLIKRIGGKYYAKYISGSVTTEGNSATCGLIDNFSDILPCNGPFPGTPINTQIAKGGGWKDVSNGVGGSTLLCNPVNGKLEGSFTLNTCGSGTPITYTMGSGCT
jgi:hypothetical protein